MPINLAVGTVAISLTVLFHTIGLMALARFMGRLIHWFRLHRHDFGKTVSMVTTVLGLFLLHMAEIWAWAGLFLGVGAIGDFGDALYFSTVTFSTVGYGDVSIVPQWRLLASLEAINGFILIGWSTAFLVAASTRYGPFRPGEHF
jgi:carbon starvation protein CstA